MPTQIQLCNAALDCIHVLPIDDIDATDDASAVVLKRNFDLALHEFLTEAFWSWAKVSDTLTEESPGPDFGWDHKFALPSDFVSLIGVNEIYPETPSDIWEIEGGFLLTDENVSSDPAQVYVEYIKKPTESELETFLDRMDPKCVPAFATLLAAKIAPQLATDGLNTATALLQRYYGVKLPKARMRNGNQNRPAPRFPYQTSTARQQRHSFMNR